MGAVKFYCEIISTSNNPKIIIQILRPFFCSTPTYRFIENICSDFFVADTILNLFKSRKHDAMLNLLLTIIKSSLQLLPPQHFDVLNNFHCKFNELHFFYSLFFEHFLIPWMRLYIFNLLSPKYKEKIYEFFTYCSKHFDKFKEIPNLVFQSHSAISIPSLYRTFDHHFCAIYLCVHDIKLIASYLNESNGLPESVSFEDLNVIKQKYKYYCFNAQIFPQFARLQPDLIPKQLFPAIDSSNLESYLSLKFAIGNVDQWNSIISYLFSTCLSLDLPFYLQRNPNVTLSSLYAGFEKIKSFIINKNIRKVVFVVLFESFWKLHYEELQKDVKILGKTWKDVINYLAKNPPKYNVTSKGYEICDKLVQKVHIFGNSSLWLQYTQVKNALKVLSSLKTDDNDPFMLFLFMIRKEEFLIVFLCLYNCIVKNDYFSENCSSTELQLWVTLDSTIMKCFGYSPSLKTSIRLYEQFLPKLSSKFPNSKSEMDALPPENHPFFCKL